jgi:hypothetical protein
MAILFNKEVGLIKIKDQKYHRFSYKLYSAFISLLTLIPTVSSTHLHIWLELVINFIQQNLRTS